MRSVRNLLWLAVVTILASMVVSSAAFAQTFTGAPVVKDTVFNGVVGDDANKLATRLLLGTFSGLAAGDSLSSITFKSCTQKEFAIQRIRLYKKAGATATAIGNYTITGRFDENFEATIAGINTPFANGDTLVVSFDAWADSIDTDTSYQETGIELVIPQYGMRLRNTGVIDSTVTYASTGATDPNVFANPGAFRTNFDAAACNPNPTGEYTRIFDLYAPTYNVSVVVLDTTTNPNICTNIINIGDSLRIVVSNPNEEITANSVTVNLSAFGGSAAHVLNYHANGAGFADDTWTDTVRVNANGTDVIPGLVISFTAQDNAGNTGSQTFQFTEAIDDIAPQIDSVKFYISENNVGSDTSAAVGDKLTLIAYMTSNGYFEISSVVADFSNFRTDSLSWTLDDVTNGNGIFRRDIWLTNEMARDIAAGSNPLKYVLITARDNACNEDTFTVNFDPALDLDPPVFSSIVYRTVTNADSSSCTNIGDSVRVTADLSGSPDIVTVVSNFLDAGLGGATNEAMSSIGSGNWEKRWKIGNLLDPNFDPNTLDAKDANSAPIDADYTIWVFATDDAGNRDSLQSGALEAIISGGVPLDTRRPTALDQDGVVVNRLPGGKLRLTWRAATPYQAQDAQYFYVYVDSTGDGFNYNSIFGTTFNGEYVNAGPDSNAWTSEVLTDGKVYKFVIRTEDDCGNWEFNTNIFEGIPDATPPVICVVFPASGGNYGPNNPVEITATTSDADVDDAWVVWRKKDRGDGTPGAWQNHPVPFNYMSNPDDGLTFFETLNLGTDPSTEGVWQALILSSDDIGNVQTLGGAESACGFFEFNWNPNVPSCDFLTINGAFAPQSPCGYEVSREEMNTAVITVADPTAEPVYTVDSWVIFTTSGDRTRVDFADDQTLPYEFDFWVADWPKTVGGPLPTYLITEITDTRNGSTCVDSVRLCLPDEVAPVAYISWPVAYQCVQKAQSSLNSIDVDIEVSEIGFDQSSPIRAELFYSLDGTFPGTKIGEEAFGGDYDVTIEWDNSDVPEGYVWLYAIVYDDQNNSYTTPWVKICVDGTLPEMTLSVKGAVQYACNGENKWRVAEDLETPIYLSAELTDFTNIDIAEVHFFVQPIGDPEVIDVFHFWEYLGQGSPANNNSIWTYTWNSDDGRCGYDYRIRVAVKDAAGNWMLDMDGDGNFDDYTFDDAMDAGAGMVIYFDCEAAQPAFSLFETTGEETRTWTNPSGYLGGSADVYAKPGETIRVQVMTIPADDSCEVAKVDYFCNGTFVGSSSNASNWWEISFNPLAMGLYTLDDVANGYVECTLEARMWDKLGQTASDYIDVFILDNIPDAALITEPGDGSYVCGQVFLNLATFDARDLKRVTWYYWPAAGGPKVKIADVWAEGGYDESGPYWGAYWNIALNNPPNGDYYVGAELCDISDNVTAAEESSILVHVNCNRPSITLTSPADGGFFCGGEYFCANVNVNGGAPIDYVQFQWKSATQPIDDWNSFPGGPDYESPWCAAFWENPEIGEGFYNFRAMVVNEADQTVYSEPITLFFDRTSPLARAIWVTDGVDTFDVENENDPTPAFKLGTKKLTFKFRALDNQSSWGPSPLYNSGLGDICANNVCVSIEADAEGYFTVTWDMSGDEVGEWSWGAVITDAVGCNTSYVNIPFIIYEGDPTMGLVAGCWNGKIFGIAEYDASTIFQYRQNGGEWIQISSNNEEDGEWLLNDNWSYTPEMWSVHYTGWVPSNGTYEVRLLSDNGNGVDESLSPIVTISVTDNGCEVTGAPGDFGPGSIERNLENDCDNLEGLAQIGSNYGMPFGVAVSYNVSLDYWDFEIIPFTALNQQGGITRYSGAFHFNALVDDGFGEGRVYFVDYNGTTGWSKYQMYNTFWVTRDYGTGGPVSFMDVTVDIPAEWTDNTGHDYNALAIWKSKLARPSVWQDWQITPVGDNNGMMTYISDPSCYDVCGEDEQYAIVTMQYDNDVTTPAESLSVMWWDGEGNWVPDNVYFPSTVRGFYRENGQNWVQFAVTCFGDYYYESYGDAWYSVVKRTKYDGAGLVSRMTMVPYCDPYTDGYPEIWYQFVEPFQYQIDWSTLEVYFDGVRIFARSWYQDVQGTPKEGFAGRTTLDEASPQWSFFLDEVSAQLKIQRNSYGEYNGGGDFDDESYYPPIGCGQHEVYVRVEDSQLRPQFIRDQIMVDCEAPDVDFANGFVTSNPTITFTIDDEGSGVDWNEVFVDVYFVTKMDTTDGGPDGSNPKERMAFIQTFFPAQIQDYLQEDGRTVVIPTTYDLDDERGLYVVVFDGTYSNNGYDPDDDYYYCYYGDCSDPSAWDNFDLYYDAGDGVEDCVGNNTTPHVQFFVVDREGATVTLQNEADACPLIFQIADDGSGMDDLEIFENGVEVTRAAQANAAAVDAAGEWYFMASGSGGTLYYCPENGVNYEIRVTDNTGSVTNYYGTKAGVFSDGDVSGWAGPNPFDPETESFAFNVKLEKAADNIVIRIFNMAGEHLKTINYGAMGAGEHAVAWNGRTDGGTMVADGGYIAEVVASGKSSSAYTVIRFAVVEK